MSKPPTFTTPRGHTASSRTVRRYVLIRETEQGAKLLNRSDSAEALATIRRRRGANAGVDYFIGDTHTAKLRRVHPSGRIDTVADEAGKVSAVCAAGNHRDCAVWGCTCTAKVHVSMSHPADRAAQEAARASLAGTHLDDAHGPVGTPDDLIAAEAAHAVACGPPLAATIRRLAAEVAEVEYAARDTALDSSLASEPVTGYLQAAAANLAGAVRSLGGRSNG